MPVPKRKTSKSKRDKRRTHKKIEGQAVMTCPDCGEAKLPHHVCRECGIYRGRNVIDTEG
ncbi:large subunit ribosomal protein L32 [Desulfosarcina sp. BuS5]|uniref:50S ribosomal protein L32 n=1 Tax=Desulfosarcina sp. BuS5 TaxID=933262 RepID=UPI0004864399|nr:50S ribosomal protein L32 [Desulfosarcina sp. BuS5]WDN88174.1 large subunit ribosomal protein L32 [Desulfosarcina sp. BuS5]